MKTAVDSSTNRVLFLDNLRSLFVLCVVLQHSANAYYTHLPILKWWPVGDSSSCTVFGVLQVALNGFTMPLLFFLAGYFALPTIRKHGTVSFILGKLKRLGIPWLVCILTICPVLPLVYHYTRNGLTLPGNYFDLWLTLMKNFLQFDTGVIPSMNRLMTTNGFYQRYMWFISLLLLFFLLFTLIYKANKAWFEVDYSVTKKNSSVWSSLAMLFIVGFICFAGTLCAGGLVFLSGYKDPASWFTLANLFQFQACSLPSFVIYFAMGVIAFRNKWYERGKLIRHLKTWILSTCILLIAYMPTLHAFLTAPAGSEAQEGYGFLFAFTGAFLTISLLGSFSSLASRYWNRPRRIDQNIAQNSYNIYLSHYIFVILFQLVFFTIPEIPAWIKFATVSMSSLICAYLAGNYLIKPFPKIAAGVAFVMLGIMFAVVRV